VQQLESGSLAFIEYLDPCQVQTAGSSHLFQCAGAYRSNVRRSFKHRLHHGFVTAGGMQFCKADVVMPAA